MERAVGMLAGGGGGDARGRGAGSSPLSIWSVVLIRSCPYFTKVAVNLELVNTEPWLLRETL